MGSDSMIKASALPTGWYIKVAHGVNLHKLIIMPVTAALMWHYSCYTSAAWTYLGLHGMYGMLWLVKDVIFPDITFLQPCSFGVATAFFMMLNTFFLTTPWVMVTHAAVVPGWYQTVAIAVFTTGMFLMIGSDAQKYWTLKATPETLITTGYFKYIRSPNYLGELLIYSSYAMLTYTPWGWLSVIGILSRIIPNLGKKDRSMSRYPEFAAYKASTWRLLPPFF